jgi:hypothetical protein
MKEQNLINVSGVNEGILAADKNIVAGPIYLVNEARLTQATFSEPLTAYATGWRDGENIEAMLNFIAPAIDVSRRFEFKKADNSEEFLSELDDERAIGSSFKRVEYKGSTINSKTLNKGLTRRLDRDDMIEGQEEQEVRRLMARILRNELRRASTALLAIDSAGTAKTWGSSANPDDDVLASIDLAGDAAGIDPNRVLYGKGAWAKRRSSYAAQTTAGANTGISMTPAQVAEVLAVEEVRVTRERYTSSASAKSKIVGAYVVSFFGRNDIGKDDPSCLKRFVSPVQSGGRWGVYREEIGAKFIDITVEHYSQIVATSTVGSKKLTIS